MTPQGLFATFTPVPGAAPRLDVAFAQSGGGAQQVGFGNVQPLLEGALQSNQLFLVISSLDLLQKNGGTTSGSVLTISSQSSDTWTFRVFEDWLNFGTILIFKFAGKSLADLVNDTSTWLSGDQFNSRVGTTQSTLRSLIADAQTRAKTEPEFVYFAETVAADPGWNGILFLNVYVPLDELPDQIAGLAAGIDPSKFYAHHLGLTMTPVGVSGGHVAMTGDSSLFGLIYYNDPADLVDDGTPYQFKVLSLKILFSNSTVSSFSSQIEMRIGQLFLEPATSPDEGSGEDNLVLNGTYQTQNGVGTYLFQRRATRSSR